MTKISKRRAELLAELEWLVGNECYNSNIQNWGPGGEFYGEGREFRYPLTTTSEGQKRKHRSVANDVNSEVLLTGYYAFGANQLSIVRGLDKVLMRLEEQYGFRV